MTDLSTDLPPLGRSLGRTESKSIPLAENKLPKLPESEWIRHVARQLDPDGLDLGEVVHGL
jgi:hypothetical protein